MSEQEFNLGTALDKLTETADIETPTADPQPIRTDVDELVEYFSKFTHEKEARKDLRAKISPTDKQRFFVNGKSYSTGNGYKAIKRCRENELFKGEAPAVQPKDLSYKMSAPPVPPRPEPEPLPETASEELPEIEETATIEDIEPEEFNPAPAPAPIQQQQTERIFNEPSTRIVKSYTFIAQLVCKKLSQSVKDPELKAVFAMDKEEADQVGYAIAVLTVDEMGKVDPRTAAIGVLVTAVLSRLIPYLPKILEKLKAKPKGAVQ